LSRLVNVSNRVALPNANLSAGGLAVGLLSAMRESGGLWFGWNGRTTPDDRDDPPSTQVHEGIRFATISLPVTLHDRCYNGFANGTLWPLLHYFLDGFRFQDDEYAAYREVNLRFAQSLHPMLRDSDVIWVHDYHLIPLAENLRARGVRARLGFFLHVPFPQFEVLRALPPVRELIGALLSYDVVGFQTSADRDSFLEAVEVLWGDDVTIAGDTVRLRDHTLRAGVFPIGVDVDEIAKSAAIAAVSPHVERMTRGLSGRRLVIGADRLDYSKGLLERFEAYRRFLELSPEHLGHVTYLQIAPLGRQEVKAYARIRDALERKAGRINGAFADIDWTPIRYLNRNFPHEVLPGMLRQAHVGLVTPVRDGMNLVAKEFIAAQDPADPGVLILSDRAGAAHELRDALLINPYDTLGIASAIRTALHMPLAERQARQERMERTLRRHSIHVWRDSFLEALTNAGPSARAGIGLTAAAG
jgi:trehalose 6-phosphate synthase